MSHICIIIIRVKLTKTNKKSTKNFLKNVQKDCMKIWYCNSLRIITMRSKLQKEQDLLLEGSAIYEVCHIGLGFNRILFTSLILVNIFGMRRREESHPVYYYKCNNTKRNQTYRCRGNDIMFLLCCITYHSIWYKFWNSFFLLW